MEKSSQGNERNSGIVLVLGIPGCGKSTFIERIIHEDQTSKIYMISFDKIERLLKRGVIIESKDEVWKEKLANTIEKKKNNHYIIIDLLIGENSTNKAENIKETEKSFDSEAWKHSRLVCHELAKLILEYHKKDYNETIKIILDDNFLLKSMRKPYYILSHKYNFGYCELKLFCDLQTCIQRNSNRQIEDRVPQEIIEDAATKIENTAHQNHYISHQNSDEPTGETIKNIMVQIDEKLRIPIEYIDEKEQEEAKRKEAELTKSNFIHQLDLKIRVVINSIAKGDKADLIRIFPSGDIQDPNKLKSLISFFSDFKNYFLESVTISLNLEHIKLEDAIVVIKKQKFFKSIKKELDSRKINFDKAHDLVLEKLAEISKTCLKNEKSYELYTNVYIEQIHNIIVSPQ